MHVALVTMNGNKDFAGGVPAVVLQRAQYLRDTGNEVSVVCRAEPGFDEHENRDGIHIYPIKTNRIAKAAFARIQSASPLFLRGLRRGLLAAHSRLPIDLIDLQDAPAILGARAFMRINDLPMVFTLHGSATVNPGPRPWIGRKLHIFYERMAYSAASRVLPVSKWIGQVPKALGFGNIPQTVIPSPVEQGFFLTKSKADPYARTLRLLFLGRIVPEKRLHDALRSVALLRDTDLKLVIVGDGPEATEMRKLAATLDIESKVEWYGFLKNRDEIRSVIAGCHIVLFPTVYEAQGLAVIEAMAAGLHAIVSDIDVLAEGIPSEFRVAPCRPDAIAARIHELAANRELLVASGQRMRTIAERYQSQKLYPKLVEEYRLVVDEKP